MKRTIAMCLSCAMLAGMLPAASAASPMGGAGTAYALGGSVRATVYNVSTQAEFEAALANAEKGATIQLTGDVATRTITDAPLVIGKSVTIEGGGNSLLLGSGGIVLEADVTMRNLKLGQGNMVRNAIMANGHTLELDNVQQFPNSGRGEFHLFCGSLTGAENNGYTNKNTGTHGRIILRRNSRFAAVYAGNYYDNLNGGGFYGGTAEQGTWTGSSSVEIDSSMNGKVPDIYAFGAWMYRSTGAVAKPVTPDPIHCPIPITNDFSVTLYDSAVQRVHGSTEAGAAKTLVTYNGTRDFNDGLSLNSISGLTVNSGNVRPSASFRENNAPVSVAGGAVLGFNNFVKDGSSANIAVGNFTGGGTITLADGQMLNISGTVSGSTGVALGDYLIGSGTGASSVPVAPGVPKPLIITPAGTADSVFHFIPYGSQTVTFEPNANDVWIAENSSAITSVKTVSIDEVYTVNIPAQGTTDPDAHMPITAKDKDSNDLLLSEDMGIKVGINNKPAINKDPYPEAFEGYGLGYTYFQEIAADTYLCLNFYDDSNGDEYTIGLTKLTRSVGTDGESAEQVDVFSFEFPPAGYYFIQITIPAEYTVDGKELKAEGTLRIVDNNQTSIQIPVEPPSGADAPSFNYTGEEQTAFSDTAGYTVTDGKGKNAGNYTAVFTLRDNCVWSEGNSTGTREITWSIAQAKKSAIPEGTVTAVPLQEQENGTLPGALNGTTTEMEYRLSGSGGSWTQCAEDSTEINAAGTYEVRYRASDNGNWEAGDVTEVTVGRIEMVKLTSISVAQLPAKTVYTVGDAASALDLSGMVLTLHWSDGTVSALTVTDAAAQGVTASGADFSTAAASLPVTVTAQGFTASFPIAVVAAGAPAVTGITISGTPKTDYKVGDSIDLAGLAVVVTYENGTTETVDVTASMVSGFDTASAGTRTVTITYGGQSTQFDIIVQEESTPDPEPDPDPEPTPEPEPIPDDEPEDASFDRKPNSGGSSPSAGKPSEPSAPVQPETPVVPETPTEWQNPYTADVSPREWYYEAVQYVSESGLMSGTGNGTFSPEVKLSRGMLAQILYNQEGRPAAGGNAFTDVPGGEWFTDAVSWAAASSIVSGYSNGAFGPSDDITREQFILILYRYAKMKGYDVSVSGTANLLGYADASQISDYAREAMAWACEKGLISGTNRGTLSPTGGATRAEAAAILMRFLENVGGK